MTLQTIAEGLRSSDPDRFGASLIASPDARARLWTLYALNQEVARAPLQSENPLLAEMRLQWWIEELRKIMRGQRPQHDLMAAIAEAWGSDVAALEPLAEARRRDCERMPFDSVDEVETYIAESAGSLMRLAVRAIDPAMDHLPAITAQATGSGIALWLAALPQLRQLGLGLRNEAGVPDLIERAHAHLTGARELRREVPRNLAPALFRGGELRRILDACAKDEPVAPVSEFRRRFALGRLALTGRWWV